MALSQERKDEIKKLIVARAQAFGQAVEHAAADQIADMHTDAADSVLRAAVICSALGVILGMYFGYVFFSPA